MSLAERYARTVVRLRWLVVAGWVGILVAVTLLLPTLEGAGSTGGLGGLAEPDNPAIQAEIRSFEKFGIPVLTRTAVVQRNPEGLSAAAQLRVLANAIDFNLDRPPELSRIEFALPVLNNFGLIAPNEQGTTAITYLYYRPDVSFGRQTGLAAEYAGRYITEPDDHLVGVTGVVPGRVAQLVILRKHLERVELATVGLIFLVVAVNFRSLGAPLLTMATAGIALGVILRLAGWLGNELGFGVPKEIEPVIVALLLGIVTDYSIFFLSGMRERLAAGTDGRESVVQSTEEFVPIVLVAGFTVAAGSLALLVARVGLFRTFGPGMAITILVGLAVAVSFVPAALAIVGRAAFWPRPPVPRPAGAPRRGGGSRLVDAIVRRPAAVAVVIVGGAALLVGAAPARNLDLGFGVLNSLPPTLEARRAAEEAGRGFLPGILSPTVLLVEGPSLDDRRPELARLQDLLLRAPGVATVAGPADQPAPVSLGAVLARSGNAARYVIVFDDDPLGARTITNLEDLDARLPGLLAEAGLSGVRASFAGDTALAETTVSQTEADLGRIVLVATTFGFVLLVIFLRALVAPLYLMAANLLAVTAALGLTTLVFQDISGHGGLTFYVPFAAAVLLISLGADYSIFGVGYIWAEARTRSLTDAIRVAVPRSTRAINAAGITLALSFALLAIVPLRPFRQFAFAMAAGILIDVFVVRSLLVPSMITMVGPAGGWPGRALKASRAIPSQIPTQRTRAPGAPAASRPRTVAVWTLAAAGTAVRLVADRLGRTATGRGRR